MMYWPVLEVIAFQLWNSRVPSTPTAVHNLPSSCPLQGPYGTTVWSHSVPTNAKSRMAKARATQSFQNLLCSSILLDQLPCAHQDLSPPINTLVWTNPLATLQSPLTAPPLAHTTCVWTPGIQAGGDSPSIESSRKTMVDENIHKQENFLAS